MNYKILMYDDNGEQFILPGIQSISEDLNSKFATLTLKRVIYDDQSLLNHVLNKGPIDILIEIGEETIRYQNLKVASAKRSASSDDYIVTENIVLTNKEDDPGLDKLKDTVKKLARPSVDFL